MGLLDGKAAIVTGGSRGIGLEVVRTLAANGSAVVIADVDELAGERVAENLTENGARALALHGDVTSFEQMESVVKRTVDTFGCLDVFVNNAGITADATLRKMSIDAFRRVIEVNLLGTWIGTKAAAAAMREQRSGAIVNMSSISGKVGNIGQSNYSASKAGVVGLTKAAAKELGHLGIRVNAIQPGLINTEMTASLRSDLLEQKLNEIPMGRAGEVAEVANVALFLASDLSSYVTGAVIEVTGGRYM